MKIHDVVQGSKEWIELRKGKLTGTSNKNVAGYKAMVKEDLVREALDMGLDFDEKKIKVEELKDMIFMRNPDFSFKVMEERVNEDFAYKMLALELTGSIDDPAEPESENPLERGTRLEPVARRRFEMATGLKVEEVGFLTLEEEERVGLSPDGLIPDENGIYIGGLEIKCPCAWKYIKYWMENVVPDEYREQVLDYFVHGDSIKTVYLMIYNPNVEIHPYHIIKVERSAVERDVRILKNAQINFWKEHDRRLLEIKTIAKNG